jgi:hypothetical protein
MRIGDKATYTGTAYPWATGREVEIKGIIRDNRTIKDNVLLDATGGTRESDHVIFSLLDADGFRFSAPDARLGDFEVQPVIAQAPLGAAVEAAEPEFLTLV